MVKFSSVALLLAASISSLHKGHTMKWKALWPMTSDLEGSDVSGHNLTAVLGPSVTVGEGFHGDPGGGLYFPGGSAASSAKVKDPDLNLTHSSIAICGFFRLAPGAGGPLIAFINADGNPGIKVWVYGSGTVELLKTETNGAVYMSEIDAPSGPFFPVGEWVHFIAQYQRLSGVFDVWRNGVRVASDYLGIGLSHRAYGDIQIGSWDGLSYSISGSIYCLGVSSKEILRHRYLMNTGADRCHCRPIKDSVRTKQYTVYPGMKMPGAKLKTITVMDEWECAVLCTSKCGCVAFNYVDVSRICELLHWSPESPVVTSGVSLYRLSK